VSAADHRAELSDAVMFAGRSLGNSSSMLLAACADRLSPHSTDWGCVLLLNEALPEPLKAGLLAELTELTTGAVFVVVDRLEAAGFVRREPDPADGSCRAGSPVPRRTYRDRVAHGPPHRRHKRQPVPRPLRRDLVSSSS
jgi:MarR family